MLNIHQSYQAIVKELTRLQDPAYSNAVIKTSLPRQIAAGPKGSILISEELEREIGKVANWMWQQLGDKKAKYLYDEWSRQVRSAFGPAMASLDLNNGVAQNAKHLKTAIESYVASNSTLISSKLITMGCSLFEQPLEAELRIGPVRFTPKLDWLARAETIGQIDALSHRRLRRAFSGATLRRRKSASRQAQEDAIISVMGKAQMACTVELHDLSEKMAQSRAITAARLGLMAVALLWRTPSRILDGFHLSVDHGFRSIRTIPHEDGKLLIGGWELKGSPSALKIENSSWNDLIASSQGFLGVAGNMISCWTSSHDYEHASELLRCLSQAMHFFWLACKEENELMAIVKFTAVLESLAGGNESGIVNLASARLGIKKSDTLVGDYTLETGVKTIYSHCRSRTLHGTNQQLLHDWSYVRAIAESLTRHCLVACIAWSEANPKATRKKDLIS